MTWTLTIEVAVVTLTMGVGAYLYAWYLARRFDREFPPRRRAPGE